MRIWHGWTTHDDAGAYIGFVRDDVFPEIEQMEGARGAYLARRDDGSEVEFVALTLWDSLEAVRAFAGEEYERSVVPPRGRELLSRFDERSAHYETVVEPYA